MSVHVFSAKAQPYTDYFYMLDLGKKVVKNRVRHSARRQAHCHTCGRLRWAKHLTIQVYYDMSVLACADKCTGRGKTDDWRGT